MFDFPDLKSFFQHNAGKLTSMSLWIELYPSISADMRFTQMLGQPGSTPLDLFKFYVEDLKSRFHSEKKIIKEILREKSFEMSTTKTFEDFATIVCEDKRSSSLDAGNVKLTYNALLEKAESKEKEKQKDEAKKLKKLETGFRSLLSDVFGEDITSETQFEDVAKKVEDEAAFQAVPEGERARMFKDYVRDLEETCMHNHSNTKQLGQIQKRSKASKKKRKRRETSDSVSGSEGEIQSPKKRGRRKSPGGPKYSDFSDSSFESDFSGGGGDHKSSSKSKKKKQHKKKASSMSPVSEDEEYFQSLTTHKKKKKSKKKSPSPAQSIEEGELSEEELEQKRMALLKELQANND